MMKCLKKGVADTDQQQAAAELIEELEAKLKEAWWRFDHLAGWGDTDETRAFAIEALEKLEEQDDD